MAAQYTVRTCVEKYRKFNMFKPFVNIVNRKSQKMYKRNFNPLNGDEHFLLFPTFCCRFPQKI